jgi:hypothetical protein
MVVRSPRSGSFRRFCIAKSLIFFVILLNKQINFNSLETRNELCNHSNMLMTKFCPKFIIFIQYKFLFLSGIDFRIITRCLNFISNDKKISSSLSISILFHTRKHHYRFLINPVPLLGMLIREVMEKQHQNHDPVKVKLISLYPHPRNKNPNIHFHLLYFILYFAHCCIISFILI